MSAERDIRTKMQTNRILDQTRQMLGKPGLAFIFDDVISDIPILPKFWFEPFSICLQGKGFSGKQPVNIPVQRLVAKAELESQIGFQSFVIANRGKRAFGKNSLDLGGEHKGFSVAGVIKGLDA